MRDRLRYFGPRGHLLRVGRDGIGVHDARGDLRLHVEVEGVRDAVVVRDEIWCVVPGELRRLKLSDGSVVAREAMLLGDGAIVQSSTAPHLPVWNGERPVCLAAPELALEGTFALPIGDKRWLFAGDSLSLHQHGARLWRQPLASRKRILDAQLVFDGRYIVLAQQAGDELMLTVATTSDGLTYTQVRIAGARDLQFSASRGMAIASGDGWTKVIDLRFGRTIREHALPEGVLALAVEETLQRFALVTSAGLAVVRADELVAPAIVEPAPIAAMPVIDDAPVEVAVEPAPASIDDGPVPRLRPASAPTATAEETTEAFDRAMQTLMARVGLAIAHGWDTGRLQAPDPLRPAFAAEVEAVLDAAASWAPVELAAALERVEHATVGEAAAREARSDRTTPFDVLVRELGLSDLAASLLIAIAAPRLAGDLARLYGILANDQGRALVDEHLLVHIFDGVVTADKIAEELDADRPLCRNGLVTLAGARPFAALAAEPAVIRMIANRRATGEREPYLTLREADRTLAELQLPDIRDALRYLRLDDAEPARIAVRGRLGSGRHSLLAALAARAGRPLAIIDLARMPREDVANILRGALQRATVRGAIPCVDGYELVIADTPALATSIARVLADHPGPLAVRLPRDGDTASPLPPDSFTIELPPRTEQERVDAWLIAAARHGIPLNDATHLAARYRVGPGIVERVCAEAARGGPREPGAWLSVLDDGVHQHLDNRLGALASRVTRLATWADVVLPEEVVDSLLELVARVRHRRKVYEQWGYDRALTTARGITALFSGGPGTGKTMVAGVIARELGLDVYRVDVSRISSKWIGETEKNLANLFDAAEDGQVLLLFDEADSLFAKRTEVRNSVDRYANMAVNYLLQRLDTFEGMAILTSNFGTSIDPAFKRRLTYRVTFPFPDEEMRTELWRANVPPQMPVTGELDFAALARRFKMSGGYIRNSALRAAFLAAEENVALSHAHLERAVRMEFREIGKLSETGTLD